MKKAIYFLFIGLFLLNCSKNDCSDAYASVSILQNDIKNLEKSRSKFKSKDELDKYIRSKTDRLLKFMDSYEKELFSAVNLEQPKDYSKSWCDRLPNSNNQEVLTTAMIGEKCRVKSDGYTLGNLYRKIIKYNTSIDKKLKIMYCRKNPFFKTVKNPDLTTCLSENDHFYNMNLNNHLIGLLRFKEAILLQEEILLLKKEINIFSSQKKQNDSIQ